jgi:CelD/BcsL family acetyltransferase involved in cellulose biosynthesis
MAYRATVQHAGLAVRCYHDITQLPATCAQLVERCASLQFDQSLEWYAVLAAHALEGEQRVRIYVVLDAREEAVAVLPMRYTPRGSWLAERPLQALATYYTSLYAPIVAPDADQTAALAALAGALGADRGDWDLLDFAPLDEHAALTRMFQEQLERVGLTVERYFRFGNWYLPTGQRSFAEYLATRSSQLRNTVTRKGKKLRSQSDVRIEVVSDPASLEPHLAAYQQVYAASWKVPEPFVQFVPEMVRALARCGWLRLGVVYLEAVPIAAQLWFVKSGTAYIFKLAYDEQHQSLSAGSVLTTTLMAHVMDVDRVEAVDYLTGDDAYKKDWMTERRERIGLRVYNRRSLRGAFAAAKTYAAPYLKRLLRRGAPASNPVPPTTAV